jgi:hypothetical protein
MWRSLVYTPLPLRVPSIQSQQPRGTLFISSQDMKRRCRRADTYYVFVCVIVICDAFVRGVYFCVLISAQPRTFNAPVNASPGGGRNLLCMSLSAESNLHVPLLLPYMNMDAFRLVNALCGFIGEYLLRVLCMYLCTSRYGNSESIPL